MCLAIFCKQSIEAEANLQNYQKLVIFERVLPVTSFRRSLRQHIGVTVTQK